MAAKAVAEKQLKVLGLDHGNVWVKGYGHNGTSPLLLPNQFIREDLLQTDPYFQSKLVLDTFSSNQYKEENYLWGQDIYKALNPINTFTSQDRYMQKPYKLLSEFALAEMSQDNDEILLVTGVPSVQKGTKAEEQLKKVFEGTHVITKNDEEQVAKVKEVQVLTQPLGTVMSIYLDDEGKVADEEAGEEYIGILDAGGGTFDVDGVKEMDAQSDDRATFHMGMYKVYQNIADWINRENPNAGATAKLVEFQILGDNPDTYKISKRSSIDIKHPKDLYIRQYAEDVIPLINQRWTNRDKFDRLALTGGAAKPLYPYLLEWEKDLILVDNSQIANVIGFYRYGVFLRNSRLALA
ncbi:hypothetical protein MKY96_33410 [Paenibacillus sp. FSL R7-0302]|uniref:ParM/StbA family protein n=1 Tax=Paenibacillus sp. FSL R7-0302 TaxID=2921681 RepID=UPI0030F9D54C